MSSHEEEEIHGFIENLQMEDQREAILYSIKNFVTYKPAIEVVTTIQNVGISKLIYCLNLKEKSHVDLTCDILKLCFDKFNTGYFIQNCTGYIMYMLRHERETVRRVVVDEIYKTIATDPGLLPIPQFIDVFVAVGQLVSDKDISVANKAILITSNLPFEAYDKVLEEMKIALEYDNTSKCNAFEVIINISLKSIELLNQSAELGYIEYMLAELQNDDVLYQLNILELLGRLAIRPYGLNHLIENEALNKISQYIVELADNPLAGLLTPGYLKFFGCVAHQYPKEIFDHYPDMLNCLFEALESDDPVILIVALDTLGFIGATVEGKLCLAALGRKYTMTVEKLGRLITNSVTETKIRAIHCLSNLISVDQDPTVPECGPIDHRVTLMTREWFRSMSSKPPAIQVLFDMCKNPFPDIKLSALGLLDAICQHPWGAELVAATAGLVEYILDRSIDADKESKEVKYDIIKRLSLSPIFDDNIIERIQTYIKQGPYYTDILMQIAMEEGN